MGGSKLENSYIQYRLPNNDVVSIKNNGDFGIIQDIHIVNILEEFLDAKGNITLEAVNKEIDKTYLNVCKVVNTFCFKISYYPEEMVEFNPTLKLECSEHSFWSVNETEYKIDVKPREIFNFSCFKKIFEEVQIKHFDTGCVQRTNSFERYLELNSNQKKQYLVLLGKKGWPKKPAIKVKKQEQGEILTRKVKILELTEQNLIHSIEELTQSHYKDVEIRKLPAFYKTKDRVVCIDNKRGYIYGLSYSEAKTLSKENQHFNQIEIEFWSQLISKQDPNQFDWENVRLSHEELILAIEAELIKQSFNYNAPGGRKYEWLSQTTKSTRKLRFEDII